MTAFRIMPKCKSWWLLDTIAVAMYKDVAPAYDVLVTEIGSGYRECADKNALDYLVTNAHRVTVEGVRLDTVLQVREE